MGNPENQGIAQVIDSIGLHPITALTSLTKQQKRAFIKEGFALCNNWLLGKFLNRTTSLA